MAPHHGHGAAGVAECRPLGRVLTVSLDSQTSPAMSRASLATLLASPGTPDSAAAVLRRRAWVVVAVVVALAIAWVQWAPLSGAIVASGWIKSELNRKTIQHQEGGIVARLLVRDGQQVRAGEALVVIADVRSDAGLDLLEDQRNAEVLHSARLEAEATFSKSFNLPQALRSARGMGDLLARERKLFAARRAALDEQVAALQAQSKAADDQIQSLQGQIVATVEAQKLASDELALNERLASEGFVERTRLIGLRRVVAEYASRLGQQRGDQAEARQRIEEVRLRIAQARSTYQQQAVSDLKESALKLREISEHLRPSADLAGRQTVRAPVDGTVMGLRIAAVGTAVGPRETLMELVPRQEAQVVEARIRPEDIEHVHVGGDAEVRLSAFEARISPHLPAKVDFVSPDRVVDPQTNAAWYAVHLRIDAAALAAHPKLHVQTGMPVEVFVATPPRSLWRYLLEPIDAFRQRALREP